MKHIFIKCDETPFHSILVVSFETEKKTFLMHLKVDYVTFFCDCSNRLYGVTFQQLLHSSYECEETHFILEIPFEGNIQKK